MSRRKRGLGSPPAVHTAEAVRWYASARIKAKQATTTISSGNCSTGLRQLLHAAENAAQAGAHHDSAGTGVKIDGAGQTLDAINDVEALFLKKCVRR